MKIIPNKFFSSSLALVGDEVLNQINSANLLDLKMFFLTIIYNLEPEIYFILVNNLKEILKYNNELFDIGEQFSIESKKVYKIETFLNYSTVKIRKFIYFSLFLF